MYPQSLEPAKPAVWKWYVAYCVAMTLMYLFCVLMGLIFLFGDPAALEMRAGEARVTGVLLFAMGLVLAVVFGVGPMLPRRKWAWVYGLVLIVIGLGSMCCLPATVPLLIWWLKPETKAYLNAG